MLEAEAFLDGLVVPLTIGSGNKILSAIEEVINWRIESSAPIAVENT